MPAVLVTDRLVLDSPNGGDVQAVFELCQDAEIQRWMPVASPYSRSDAEFFIDAYVRHGELSASYTTWALREEAGSPLIGTIELRKDMAPASSSLGCWIGAPYRRRGLMTEALRAVVAHAFAADGLGLRQLRWQGLAGNAGSVALARALGFTLEEGGNATFEFRGEARPAWTAVLRA